MGARPQFVKASAISRAIASRAGMRELLVHTGQHYDERLSDVFFKELGLPSPAHHLGVGSGSHGWQTGEMLKRLEPVIEKERPEIVLLYGDTNSTLAGALAAAKLGVASAHVESGLRSFRRTMPEEINRVIADRLASLHFCPSQVAVENLAREGIRDNVHLVGDVMHDVLLARLPQARSRLDRVRSYGLAPHAYALATVHRAENTDDPARLRALFEAFGRLADLGLPVVLPLHPRTASKLSAAGLAPRGVHLLPPLSYDEMLTLQAHAKVILTDSGGVQKEAYWVGRPCVTMRDETEWVETVSEGWNVLVGADPDRIVDASLASAPTRTRPPIYGDGRAAERIIDIIEKEPPA